MWHLFHTLDLHEVFGLCNIIKLKGSGNATQTKPLGQEKKREFAQSKKDNQEEIIAEVEEEVVCAEESQHILDIRA